jgi:hypothetical protein
MFGELSADQVPVRLGPTRQADPQGRRPDCEREAAVVQRLHAHQTLLGYIDRLADREAQLGEPWTADRFFAHR